MDIKKVGYETVSKNVLDAAAEFSFASSGDGTQQCVNCDTVIGTLSGDDDLTPPETELLRLCKLAEEQGAEDVVLYV